MGVFNVESYRGDKYFVVHGVFKKKKRMNENAVLRWDISSSLLPLYLLGVAEPGCPAAAPHSQVRSAVRLDTSSR